MYEYHQFVLNTLQYTAYDVSHDYFLLDVASDENAHSEDGRSCHLQLMALTEQ